MSFGPGSFPFDWPLIILDFEASSLDEGSFPVEVGLAVLRGPGQPLRQWSALITPAPEWRWSGRWSRRSEAVHGLSCDRLDAEGETATAVASRLNDIVEVSVVIWCDGGDYDAYWLERLFAATAIKAHFVLRDIDDLVSLLPRQQTDRYRLLCAATHPRHRAAPDALRLLKALAQAMAIPFEPAIPLFSPVSTQGRLE